MAIKLPRLTSQDAVSTDQARGQFFVAAPTFANFWNQTCSLIERTFSATNTQVTQIQQALQAIQATQAQLTATTAATNAAQASADQGTGGFVSGTDNQTVFLTSSTFATICTINLTGVTAGTLNLTGSGPVSDTTPSGFGGEVQIIDSSANVVSAPSYFQFDYDPDANVTNLTISPTIADPVPGQLTTGSVSYLLQARALGQSSGSIGFYLFARRTA